MTDKRFTAAELKALEIIELEKERFKHICKNCKFAYFKAGDINCELTENIAMKSSSVVGKWQANWISNLNESDNCPGFVLSPWLKRKD